MSLDRVDGHLDSPSSVCSSVPIFLKVRALEFSDFLYGKIKKKSKMAPFWPKMCQNDQFWTVFGQNGRNGVFFSKKRLEHFSRTYKPYLTAKFQKKVMNGFRENAWRRNGCTYDRTDVIPKVSTPSWSRDQKLNCYFCYEKQL